ncbi:uroporphyrin-III C-methyltransferase/precorrin-2 dehydrogenase/sirohydrochlorin ferrochelatase [Novosphingobium sp. PhB165]|uniref:precorrin-2 dehydrogenase/sirohydrochlorin ferrochelatase family protein n=1 Tax=Novosphingobium sp. PhB165 TaxID=2485105 RepID=UPI00104400E5|nr:NAD(P)-dependent oxidoreductase [Novosphingobium sp. PhB165]TCM17271.1 uroporphyrin-III C-methyltransferase/precorrin-2 dehydrogenase/sirohydrochlorin ferrochelatase [Novosphingobium sp. PhB165]
MIASLPLFHRVGGRPVVVLGVGEAAEAKRRLVERAGGVVFDDLAHGRDAGARLAFIAHEDDAAAEADALRARQAGMLVNVVDRPALCDFTAPAVLDRSPVLVAIGTGGASAGLAKQLRLRFEALLPGSLGQLADALHAARGTLRARFPDAGDRRRALDAAFGQGGALDPLADGAAARVEGWLASAAAGAGGRVEVRLRSHDPEDLTLREARLLGSADLLLYEEGVGDAVLARARADAARRPLESGEEGGDHAGLVVILRAPH